MLVALVALALADDLRVVGFSPTGHLFTMAELAAGGAGVRARLVTWDVPSGAWNHLPAEATAPTADEALRAAIAKVPVGYVVPLAEAAPGEPLRLLREGSRDHTHGGAPHVTSWSTSLGGQIGVATLSEVARPGCAGDVEPWLTWSLGGAGELLADRNPPRWPACTLSYEVYAALTGPRGSVVFLLRAVELRGDELVTRWVAATTRPSGVAPAAGEARGGPAR
ncbi:MAG TPA: hypothetical protein PKA64_11970 [Myxococcota bacterium]|nr:hypothetical protein [Myxococcota bacterium]